MQCPRFLGMSNDIVSSQASLDLGEGVEILAPAELSRVASRWEWIF